MSFQFRANGRSNGESAAWSSEAKLVNGLPAENFEIFSDEDLMAQLVDGTHDAMTTLFERHNQLVLSIARRVLKDEGEAEETLQQVFLDVYKAANLFDRSKASFKIWLIRYAYTRAINRKKQLASKGFYSTQELVDQIVPVRLCDGANGSLRLASSELEYLVSQLLNTVKPRQREAIELTFFQGMTAEEIAAQTGETAPAVRHNLYRGLHKLRLALLQSQEVKKAEKAKSEREGVVLAYRESL